MASANATIVKTIAQGRGKDNELVGVLVQELENRDKAQIGLLREAFNIQQTLSQELFASKSLRTHGLLPMIQDPESRIAHEIETVMTNMGCSRQEAIDFLLMEVRRTSNIVVGS